MLFHMLTPGWTDRETRVICHFNPNNAVLLEVIIKRTSPKIPPILSLGTAGGKCATKRFEMVSEERIFLRKTHSVLRKNQKLIDRRQLVAINIPSADYRL